MSHQEGAKFPPTVGTQPSKSPAAWEDVRAAQMTRSFSPSLVAMACVFLGLLFGLSKFTTYGEHPERQIEQYYQWVSDEASLA